jgi:hypothetical protein
MRYKRRHLIFGSGKKENLKKTMDAVYATDEYGRPYVIVRDQGKKSRLQGLEAQKVSLNELIPSSRTF